ncbi:MAG: hypothetical protein J6Z43_01680 [Clostridiales bacterium]|nr:hypothetical protein [Clostridiales bacterium]
MKLETNLSKKDKMTIAIFLFIGAVFMIVWFLIRPAFTSITTLNDEIEQAEVIQTQYKNKIINLVTAEAVYDRAVTDLAESTDCFYEVMKSSDIDRMVTTYILEHGLYPEELRIGEPNPVNESPYAYSAAAASQTSRRKVSTPTPTPVSTSTTTSSSSSNKTNTSSNANATVVEGLVTPYSNARSSAKSTAASEVQCVELRLTVTGTPEACQAMIDDLCTRESLRITSFEWADIDRVERLNEETGLVELVESGFARLKLNINLYMADITDYEAAVSDAVDAASGAEG